MANPIVVQGVPVSAAHSSGTPGGGGGGGTFNGKGVKQETRCRDPIFAILLYACVIAIFAVAMTIGLDAFKSSDQGGSRDYKAYVAATVIMVVIAFFMAGLGLLIMMWIPGVLIKVSLIFVVSMWFVLMILSFAAGSIGSGILMLIFFLFMLCYVRAAWPRIPFATANLVTACTAIRSNMGVTVYAYFLTALAGGWSVLWAVAFVGVFDQTDSCSSDPNQVCDNPSYGAMFGLFVCYFFTQQVLQNCIHVTVAGMVGNWWFEPSEASHCCSSAVNNAFLRTITTSFGSICFGSLIVAILQALRMLASAARDNGDGNFLACIAECILACLASLVEYFNKWAFIYVGLYGYSYLEAGKNVLTLFQNRGWEAVIADDLVQNTLLFISLFMGVLTGVIGIILDLTWNLLDDAGGNSRAVAFFLGFIVGLVITSILMSTIGSAVNAVIVLFAEAPAEFERNYATLSNQMRTAWALVYPGSI